MNDIRGALQRIEVGFRKGDDIEAAIARLPESPPKVRKHMRTVFGLLNAQKARPDDPESVGIAAIHVNPWNVLVEYILRQPGGKEEIIPLFRGLAGVGVLAISRSGHVALVNQWRCRPDRQYSGWELELPRGICNPDESPEDGALRELREECGLSNDPEIFWLCDYSGNPAVQGLIDKIYIALDCEFDPAKQQLDDNEQVELNLVTLQQVMHSASLSCDGFLKAALFEALSRNLLPGWTCTWS